MPGARLGYTPADSALKSHSSRLGYLPLVFPYHLKYYQF